VVATVSVTVMVCVFDAAEATVPVRSGEFSGVSQALQRWLDLAVEPRLPGASAEALALKK